MTKKKIKQYEKAFLNSPIRPREARPFGAEWEGEAPGESRANPDFQAGDPKDSLIRRIDSFVPSPVKISENRPIMKKQLI
jgi:hypothetical protein